MGTQYYISIRVDGILFQPSVFLGETVLDEDNKVLKQGVSPDLELKAYGIVIIRETGKTIPWQAEFFKGRNDFAITFESEASKGVALMQNTQFEVGLRNSIKSVLGYTGLPLSRTVTVEVT